jgi:hypothetical protein
MTTAADTVELRPALGATGERSRPAVPRRRGRLAVLALAALIPALALASASVRGPFYLEINIDPEYAYLLNSLAIAQGRSAGHTDHPGSTVQLLGAATIRAVALFGDGRVRDQVLSRPEFFLRAIQIAIVGVATMLSAVGGLLALRATGSLLAAAAVQLAPILTGAAMILMDRVEPEPLVVGLGAALAGVLLLVLHREPGPRDRRAAVVAGLLVGLATACKFLFAPMALVPLVALATWRHRTLYMAAGAASFLLATIPAWAQAGRTLRWLADLAWRTGPHGRGQGGVVVLSAYPAMLATIIKREPVYAAIVGLSLAAPLLARLLDPSPHDPGSRRRRRTLLGAAGAQLLLLLIIAKHPSPHYLASGVGVAALSLVLAASFIPLPSLAVRRAVVALTLLALLALAGWRTVQLISWREGMGVTVRAERQTAAFLAGPEGAGVLHGSVVSSPQSALQFGNWYVAGRYGDDLARLYPAALGWDFKGITAFGAKPGPERLARAELRAGPESPPAAKPVLPLNAFRAVVSRSATYRGIEELSVTTLRSFGREWLIRAERVPAGARPFTGFTPLSGLDRLEGPFPWFKEAQTVRWGLPPATFLRFDSPGGPTLLSIDARPNNRPGQAIEFLLNGTPVHTHQFRSSEFEPVTLTLEARPGANDLELRFAHSERYGYRDLCVLFRKLQVLPAPSAPAAP